MVAGLETHHRRARCASATGSSTTCHPKDRDIAMVFQNYALYPHMTVAENIGFALEAASGSPRTRDRSPGARRRPGCSSSSEYLDRKPGQLSRRPAPAGGDGPGHRAPARRCSSWTSRCRTSTPSCASRCGPRSPSCSATLGVTTIYVTHDQVEAMTMGDRVAVHAQGRAAAGRHARRPSTTPRRTCSSPPSSARPR